MATEAGVARHLHCLTLCHRVCDVTGCCALNACTVSYRTRQHFVIYLMHSTRSCMFKHVAV